MREVGAVTAREQPDVALVGLGLSSEHALDLIGEIVREASCPVIALLHANDPAYIHEAAKRGVFAYIIDGTPEELQSAIDITLQRFTEYHNLQGAFGRRATIEQAKGILMARHAIDAETAFEMLRDHSQHNGRKLVDVASAIVESHLLLLAPRRGAVPYGDSSADGARAPVRLVPSEPGGADEPTNERQ
jgi:response regulator NasT